MGFFTGIGLSAPLTAVPGSVVSVYSWLTNMTDYTVLAAVIHRLDSSYLSTTPSTYVYIAPRATVRFDTSFTMPSNMVWIVAESLVDLGMGDIVADDIQQQTVSPSVVAGPSGAITDKFVSKAPEGMHLGFGSTVNADGNSFEIGVRIRNTSAATYTFSCKVEVTAPDGVVSSPAPDSTGMAPGEELLFGPFQFPKVTKPGLWRALIVVMAGGVQVAGWGPGTCINVTGYSCAITGKWVNKGGKTFIPMPASVDADGATFEIGVKWKNLSTFSYAVGVEIVVKDPTAQIVKSVMSPYYSMAASQERSNNWNITNVNKAGQWVAIIKLITQDGSILDMFEGVCLNASGPTGSITGMWFNFGFLGVTRATFGSSITATGENFEVGVRYKSTTPRSDMDAGVRVEVWDPDGLQQPTPAVDFTGMDKDEELEHEYQFGAVNKTGEWTVKLTFITKVGELIAEWPAAGNGILFRATPKMALSELKIISYRKAAGGTAAQAITVAPGDSVAVDISFKYTTPSAGIITLVTALNIPPGVDYPIQHSIQLPQATNAIHTGTYEIPIRDDVGLRDDTYHLRVYIPGYDLVDQVENAVICTGMPAGIGDLLGSVGSLVLMMVMMLIMSMLMQFMEEPVEYTKKGVKYVAEKAAPIVQIFAGGKD